MQTKGERRVSLLRTGNTNRRALQQSEGLALPPQSLPRLPIFTGHPLFATVDLTGSAAVGTAVCSAQMTRPTMPVPLPGGQSGNMDGESMLKGDIQKERREPTTALWLCPVPCSPARSCAAALRARLGGGKSPSGAEGVLWANCGTVKNI